MKQPFLYRGLVVFLALGTAALARADVSLPALFSTHAVLQKSPSVPIWGKASPGEKVTVTLDKAAASAQADEKGRWRVVLDLQQEEQGPFVLTVEGKNKLTVVDVLVGEVWLCSGQSNMAFTLAGFQNAPGVKEEIDSLENPKLRCFNVAGVASATPNDEVGGQWLVSNPKTKPIFSATAYYFGKSVQGELGAPVGLIVAAWGGTCIQPWTRAEALDATPVLKPGKDKTQKERADLDHYVEAYHAWTLKYDRQDHPAADPQAFAAPGIDTTDWKPVTLPGDLATGGLPDAGAVWIRRTVPVPSPSDVSAGNSIDLTLGNPRDVDEVYWNGKKIGAGDYAAAEHRYPIRGNVVTPGEGVLAVRLFDPGKGIGIAPGNPRFQANHFQLSGEWLAKTEFALPPLSPEAEQSLPARPTASPASPQNVASYLYNGMIHPLVPMAIAGVIWYHENNGSFGYEYRTALPLLIKDWRQQWGRGDLPFYYVQIPGMNAYPIKPDVGTGSGNGWAEVREAQLMTLAVPNTGMAVLIDTGDTTNPHPANKKEAGTRLAAIALARTYGKPVPYASPLLDFQRVEGDKIRLHFKNYEGGLVAKPVPATYQPDFNRPATMPLVRNSPGSELEGFAICGEDHKWAWAQAKIDGKSDVLVSSPEVPKPVAVRYAFADHPAGNLDNSAGFPAAAFRTDEQIEFSQKRNTRYGFP